MIFVLNNLYTSTRDPSLDIVATFNRDQFIIFPMEYGDIAFQAIADHIEVAVKLAGGAADDVVECMPCRIVSVAEKAFK